MKRSRSSDSVEIGARIRIGALTSLVTSVVCLIVAMAAGVASAGPSFAIVDLKTGRTIAASDPTRLDEAVAPGSTMKVAALVALLESRVISPATRIACTRTAVIGGHAYPCSHPDFHRPLTPAEALAHSCNSFFAAAAARLPRPALERACRLLGLTVPPANLDVRHAVLGLDGVRETPRQMLDALSRLASGDARVTIRDDTRRVVLEGLRGAATFGTAAAFASNGIDALAKTGSMGGARPYGLVVAVTPSAQPTRGIVLLAANAAGRDAAALAAQALKGGSVPSAAFQSRTAARSDEAPDTIRVGFARTTGGYDVRTLDLEDYVARVIAGEAAVRSPDAALDALAITIRTFAAANRGRHAREGFDVCDLTHCQVVRAATEATRSSARRTAGRILRYQGAPATVYYTASCGGRSELPSAVWPGHVDPPFLPSRADAACVDPPSWSADITAADLLRALRSFGFTGGSLRDLRVITRTRSGRADTIQLRGLTPATITGQDLRLATGRTLGWNLIRSAAFQVTRTGTGYRFSGRGAGHGVGLCVLGSVRMALDGASADRILNTYFPGTGDRSATARSDAPALTVLLSVAEEPLRGMVEGVAQHLWTSIRRRAGTPLTGAATLRFHPTVESYRRATRQPWWVAATTTGTESQLLPVSALRDRGILEQTIAHELAHIVTAPRLEGRPLWVKEGAAIYFAGERFGPAPPKVKCPTDDELAQAPSAGALRAAYTRAAACFVKRVEAGQDWTAIKP